MPAWSLRLLSELDAADRRAESVAAGINPAELNWRPSENAWSIGQCLDHLRAGTEVMVPALSTALEHCERRTVDEITPGRISRWFIRNYIAPNPGGRRAQAPNKIQPASQVEPNILTAFLQSNDAARALVRHASDYDVNCIRYKNPFVPLLRFTVGVGLEIIAKHEARHLLQAENVRHQMPAIGAAD